MLTRRSLMKFMGIGSAAALAGCAKAGSAGSGSAAGSADLAGSAGSAAAEPKCGADSRVVALSRSVGELWLLAGGNLVGATDDSFDLEGISDDVTSVGSIAKPDQEAIVALEPDFVMLAADIPTQKKLREALEDLGIACYPVDINSFEDYAEVMRELTSWTGRDDLYAQNVEEVQDGIDAVKEDCASQGLPDQTYLALRVSATKNKVLKSDYFACEIFDDLGLTNVADDTSSLDDLSLEAIAAADPCYIFVIPQGKDDEAQAAFEQAFSSQPVWADLTATKEDRVVTLPKDLYQYKPNARWAEAYQQVLDVRDAHEQA